MKRIFISSVQKEFADPMTSALPRIQKGCSQGAVGVQSQGAVGALSVKDRCVMLLRSGELGKKQIAEDLGLAARSGYLLRVLSELIEEGLVERTISDPKRKNSRLQKYRLTANRGNGRPNQ